MYLLAHLAFGAVTADAARRLRRGVRVDFRWILLGTILPDLVDKPLGFALGLSGRIWTHTALASVALTLLGLAWMRRGSSAATWLAVGSWTHLVLDRMWDLPVTLLYPLFGFAFPPADRSLLSYLLVLVTDPVVWGGEIVGGVVLFAMAWRYGVHDWPSVRSFLAGGDVARSSGARRRARGSGWPRSKDP